MAEQTFDIVILGGGSGGYATALRASELGFTVGMIEKDKVGGTCLHRGCIPTKALLHAAEVADYSRESSHFGVNTTFNGVDIAAVTAYREGIVAKKYKGLQSLVKARGVTTIIGRRQGHRPHLGQGRRGHHHRQAPGARDRLLLPQPPGPRARRTGHHVGAGPHARLHPQEGRRARRRRDRRGVRQRLEVLRLRRHHHRRPAPPRAERGGGHQQGPRARLPQARNRLQARRPLPERDPGRSRRRRDPRERRDRRGRTSARGRRSRPGHRGPRVRGERHLGRPRLRGDQ